MEGQSAMRDRAPLGVLVLFTFLLPFFFVPSAFVPFGVGKSLFVFAAAGLAAAYLLLSALRAGEVVLPATWWSAAFLALPLVYLVSALFAPAPWLAVFGNLTETDTLAAVVSIVLISAGATTVLRSKRDVWLVYGALFVSFGVVAVVQGARLVFGANALSFGALSSQFASVVGSWNDLGVFFGLIALAALSGLETGGMSRALRTLCGVALAVSLVFLVIIQFTAVWYALGVGALFLLAYGAAVSQRSPDPAVTEGARGRTSSFGLSVPVVATLVVSIVFILSGGLFGDAIAGFLGGASIDVRPSWSGTLSVAGDTLRGDPLFGAGPNHFSREWLRFKPDGVNPTAFWSLEFGQGVGFLPTELVSAGIVGALAWLVCVGFVLYFGARSLFLARARRLVLSSFVSVAYLWALLIVYSPGIVLVTLTFLLTGTFLALLTIEGVVGRRTISFSDRPARNFIATVAAVCGLIALVVAAYAVVSRAVAGAWYERAAHSPDIQETERHLSRALRFFESDRVLRSLAGLYDARLAGALSDSTLSDDDRRVQFQTLFGAARDAAERAIAIDGGNYQNWLALGGVYETLVPFGVEGALDNARAAYDNARARNPRNPALPLTLARLEARAGNFDTARERITDALALKPNYTDAVFLLSQIQVTEGNTGDAIRSVEAATVVSPNNPALFFQLGLLHYSARDFDAARSAFERAVVLNPAYANAKYFLGLSYYELGRRADAVAQFEDVALLNPDNKEVALILANLNTGRAPLSDAEPPLDEPPETRQELPVVEAE